ncbi:glycosyl hydrolase family 95 catalytic domain-containing protein [Dactylosporangium darangshiense]|uniref:Beta/gamma crystallin 'Greek key' domain-containing protein n=1 Tax=Dactylosporangium darangshiense TaxID=579108 RepID=A0ABP8DLB0_9ACTN
MSPIPWRRAFAPAAVAATLAGLLLYTVVQSAPASASTTDAAFNSSTGTLNVNYGSYLAKHDIVYNSPNTNPLYGLTVGNGRTGAMVWNANQMTMQVSGVDLSEQSAYAAGNVTLNTTPALNSGYTTFQQRLSLYDGTLTTKYDSNRTVTIMGSPNSEVMGIHVDDSRTGLSNISLDLSLWDLNAVTNSADVPNLTTWKTASTFADSTGIGISRGQADPNGFGYTLAATVEGASYTSSTVNGTQVRLNITPTSSYTIWFTAASRINAANRDSVAAARSQLSSVKSTGYATTFNNYKNWWHDFWGKSFVQYSNGGGDADYMENAYYLATYMIAAGAYGNYPYHFINGVFRATQDNTKWSNGYWYWNQRDVYNSFLASNHTDVMATFNKLYSRNQAAMTSYTQTRYGVGNALWVPETMGWDGNARGTINSDYVNDIYSTGTEAAYNMYLQYRYTNDAAYLSNTVYPFMRDVLRFYQNRFQLQNNEWVMPNSNAHETYWDVRNAITDLAAVRLLAPIAIQVSTDLNVDSTLRTQWQDLLNRLHPYQVSNGAWLPHDPPAPAQQRNGENVTSELIWPYDRTGIGAGDYQTALNSWNNRPNPYSNVWANDAAQAARLGLGDQAYNGMKLMLQRYQNYPNGMTNNTNGVFEYLGIHLVAMNESLMQSYNDKIRVFPAAPSIGGFVGKFTLLAKDGFLVSSEREGGEIKYVGLRSLYGKQARVVNPWGTQQVQVRRTSDNAILQTSSAAEITFATAANTNYVVERTAKLLSSYSATTLTGTQNNGVKSLSGTASTLGLGGGSTPPGNGPTFYSDINYGGTAVQLGTGNYDLSQLQSAGIANDSVSSIRVPSGYSVTAYGDSGFAGPSWTFNADTPNLSTTGGNDAISSVRITTTGGTGGVALRSRANNLYVSAPNNGTSPLIASASTIGAAERFTLVDLGGGNVAIRAQVNNQYVCAENAGAQSLIANRASAGSWETFRRINNADGSVSFQATVNSKYVTAENGGAAPLIANRDAIGPWEQFDLTTL